MLAPEDGWLADILVAARSITRITAGLTRAEFEADELRRLSVERLFEIIGEAAKQIGPGFRAAHPQIPWRQMAGMRDVLIHAYRDVDSDQVWQAVSVSVPALMAALEPLLPPMDDQ